MKLLLLMFSFTYLTLNAQSIVFSENTLIKSEDDKYINLHTFDSIMGTNKFTMKLVTNQDKSLKHIQLLSKTEADYNLEKELNDLDKKEVKLKVPNFDTFDYSGNQIKLDDYDQKMLFLHFWSTKEEDTVEKIEALNSLFQHFKQDQNVGFVSVNFDDQLTEGEKEIINTKIDFPIIFDSKNDFKNYYVTTPKYLLKNKTGTYSYISSDFKTVDFFIKMITNELSKKATDNE